MKTKLFLTALALAALSTLNSNLSTVFAQGALTPAGAPAATMKTLAQIEPRIPISSLPFIINAPGSYYVTTNLTAIAGSSGILISNSNVTLDLEGFLLAGVSGAGHGIQVSATTNVVIRNGTLANWPTNGVYAPSPAQRNLVIDHINISTVGSYGISANNAVISGCVVNNTGAVGIEADNTIVRDCTVEGSSSVGIFLVPGTVSHCLVQRCVSHGIFINAPGSVVSDNICRGNNTANTAGTAGIFINDANNRIENNHITGNGAAGTGVGSGGSYAGNLIIKNFVSGHGANNYVLTGTPVVGPIITASGTITSVNPWANFSY